jgi:DNA repair protein RecN (Recombination protein N)
VLSRIYIKNFLIIDELDLDLRKGLNVITGETGSGKSLILDSIFYCLNGKISNALIGSRSDKLIISLSFTLNKKLVLKLSELDIETEDNQIIISRQISNSGTKKLSINNEPASQKVLDEISEDLILIYGQHSLNKLFKQSYHLNILDNFLKSPEILNQVSSLYQQMNSKIKENEDLLENIATSKKEEEFLRHAKEELYKAEIKNGEEQELSDKRIILQKQQKYKDLLGGLIESISAKNFTGEMSSVQKQIARSNYADDFEEVYIHIEKSIDHISEAESILERMALNIEDESSLEYIEDRLFEIRDLAKKYKVLPDQLNSFLEGIDEKLEKLDSFESMLLKNNVELAKLVNNYNLATQKLSEMRRVASLDIEKLVESELKFLNMAGCRFKVDIISDSEKKSEKGIDKVSFMAATNIGSAFGSIEKIASGGEMARFMLALQVALFSKNETLPTIIFDEIDTGLGGAVADSVGLRLKKLSEVTQIFAVTHQPQVASKSDYHIMIIKKNSDGSTVSSAKLLDENQKTEEIARMLSGQKISSAAIEAAKIMIASADK